MKDQEQFMMDLLDFSNLPSKRTQYENLTGKGSHVKKNSNINNHNNNPKLNQHNHNNIQNQFIIPSSLSNPSDPSQRLLQSFNNLRQKLQMINRQNITLKQQIQNKNKQISQSSQRQGYLKSVINQKNKKLSCQQQQLIEYKRRVQALKFSSQQIQLQSSQLQSLKLKLSSLYKQNSSLKQQLQKNIQISITQKLSLQQKLQYLTIKQLHYDKSIQQIQNKLYEKNTQFMKLDNQYKKLKIVYDEEVFNKKITGEKEIISKENKELLIKLEQAENKYRKEKNKKYQLEAKLLELEEKVRLYGTKTDIYQGQLNAFSKKMKKVQKDQTQAKKQANAALQQRLSWQEKFYNSLIVAEQLISRVKRQLIGDVVELAKVAQFRLNKLKNDEKIDLYTNNSHKKLDIKRNKSSSVKKLRSQTISNSNKKDQHHHNNEQQRPQCNLMTLDKQYKLNSNNKIMDSFSKTVLKQANNNFNIINNNNNNNNNNNDLVDVKRNLFNVMNTPTTKVQKKDDNVEVQSLNLESKIRKQRQLMEKKLREKILYNKIQDATNESAKSKLRDQFFTLAAMNL